MQTKEEARCAMTREEAYQLFKEYNQSESLIKHALAVEAVMRYFAAKKGEDVEYWGTIGLLHDLDYEKYPEQHCKMTEKILRERGEGEDVIHAIVSHGYGICTDVEPVLYMEKVLYTIDELTGLITATVYMRPDRSILDLEVKSVKKKFKNLKFAAGVDRDIIQRGAELIAMELDEIMAWTIQGMKEQAENLGLAGFVTKGS